ncbi:MAG: tRNA pseudouridine(13) synthase TruD [Thaumarchaeota archaeon]|nr:tRNA pseudouridine(13) synthase TruD [Nitrososphaerota archaeon]
MVPKIDILIGISTYCTESSGSGGTIRISPEHFAVSEVLRRKALDKIGTSGKYAVYTLKKSGIDTTHALAEIFKNHGLRLKALGLKDANANTEQFVCDMNVSHDHKNITTNRYLLERIGYLHKPLTKKDMIGNRFRIRIDGADFVRVSNFEKYDKILNFYGYQRFGSRRPISHLVGRSIIQADFDGAVETLLSTTSEFDLPENTKIRTELRDRNNFVKMSKDIPPQMDIERMIVQEMIERGDPKRALHSIPIWLRRFFVEAYQSFIFNKTVSMAYEMGEDLFQARQGDVCYDRDDNLGMYQNDPEQKLSIPLVGYSYKKTRFDYQISRILAEEQIRPKDFFVKEMQEASSEGGFRQSLIQCKELEVEEPYLAFTLSRGSYATIMLREIMKPADPIAAGF